MRLSGSQLTTAVVPRRKWKKLVNNVRRGHKRALSEVNTIIFRYQARFVRA